MQNLDGLSERERMVAGAIYNADDPELKELNLRAMRLSAAFHECAPEDEAGRERILKSLLGHLGEGSQIRSPLFCDYGFNIRIGSRVFVNFGLVALDVCGITIGDDVQIGPRVQLLTPTHPLEAEPRRAKLESGRPISIGDNVWLGGGVIVCPGVRIGADTVVGAGSVVTKDLPEGVLAVGNPARVVRTLDRSKF